MILGGLTVMLAHMVRHGTDPGPALLVGVLLDRATEQFIEGWLPLGLGLRLGSAGSLIGTNTEQATRNDSGVFARPNPTTFAPRSRRK